MRDRSLTGLFAVALLAATGCDSPTLYGDPPNDMLSDTTPPVQCPESSTIGVPSEMRPVYGERLALYAADRARTEPDVSNETHWSKSYPPVPPLLWDGGLGTAALVHSVDMHDTPCFQHQSCDGTDPFTRIKAYMTLNASGMGENIAAGVSDGQQVIESSWINEVGAAPGETGHRENMFNGDFNYVGFGYVTGGSQYQGYWTQDLAGAGTPAPFPRLPAGSHFPQAGSSITFGTVYYDAAGTAPDKVEVYVDGKPHALELMRGSAALGGYEANVAIRSGCHGYKFVATAGGKTVGCYPGKGQLGVGDSINCAEYLAK